MAPITNEELHVFHRMDREIFSRLVINLARDPAQSLLVMALWLWLETIGYPNPILQMIILPNTMIGVVAGEAVLCLELLELENIPTPTTSTALPLTTALLQREISPQLFIYRKFTAIAGIKHVLNKTCSRIFTDILRNIYGISPYQYHIPLVVPGFPHPLFGTFTIPPTNLDVLDLSDPRIWSNINPSDYVSDDDKTLFLTFSRGFHVTEAEVRYVFTATYGNNVIKAIQMGNGDSNVDQVLFATMVLKNVEALDQILNGKNITKLRVNGKHIWARKYERRD